MVSGWSGNAACIDFMADMRNVNETDFKKTLALSADDRHFPLDFIQPATISP